MTMPTEEARSSRSIAWDSFGAADPIFTENCSKAPLPVTFLLLFRLLVPGLKSLRGVLITHSGCSQGVRSSLGDMAKTENSAIMPTRIRALRCKSRARGRRSRRACMHRATIRQTPPSRSTPWGSSPVQIAGSWTQIFSGMDGSFGIQPGGTLRGWGANTAGQLAQANLYLFRSPVQIAGSWTQVGTAGTWNYGVSFGIRSNGTLWTWGCNSSAQLGNGNTTDRSSPVQISGGGSWIQALGGANSAFGIKTNGTVWAWGDNDGGQIGDEPSPVTTPVQLFQDQGSFTQVTTGDDPSAYFGIPVLVLNTQHQLWAMGLNGTGELGVNSSTSNFYSPVQVLGSWNQVSTSYYGHTVAIRSDGTLWTWGDVVDSGNLGIGTNTLYSSPVQVTGSWHQITSASTGCQNTLGGKFALGLR
jgi:hypothetical protein